MLQAASVRWSRAEVEAITDGLTGLYNHRYLQVRLEEEIERARGYDHVSLLFIDCDEFKRSTTRRSQGRRRGAAPRRARGGVRSRRVDLVARYGGDEFVVALLGTGSADAVETAERIRRGMTTGLAGRSPCRRASAWPPSAGRRRQGRADRQGRLGHVRGQAGRPRPRPGVPRRARRPGLGVAERRPRPGAASRPPLRLAARRRAGRAARYHDGTWAAHATTRSSSATWPR